MTAYDKAAAMDRIMDGQPVLVPRAQIQVSDPKLVALPGQGS